MTSTSAPSAAACGSATSSTPPPVSAARSFASRTHVRVRGEARPGRRPARAARRSPRRAAASAPCCWRRRRGRSASARPAGPNRSRMVCRSASTWHGWNWSVSALTTGTVDAGGQLGDAGTGRRCARRSRRRSGTAPGAVSAIVSPRPSWLVRASTISGWPPSWAMPDLERHPGARGGLVEQHRDRARARPAGVRPNGSAFIASARSRTVGLLVRGSGRRRAGSGGSSAAPPMRRPGRRAGRPGTRSACASVSTSGGASRIRSGTALLTRNPASRAAAATAADDRLGEHDPEQQPGAVDAARPAGGPAPRRRWRSSLPTRLTWSSSPSSAIVRSTASAGRAAHRVAAERGAVLAGFEQVAGRADGRCRRRSAARRRAPWPA